MASSARTQSPSRVMPTASSVVAVLVDGPQHVVGGDARHLVLGRLPAEQHDEADAVGSGMGRVYEGRPVRDSDRHGAPHR